MKLGNSNGNNRGKKYMIRAKQEMQEPTEANIKKYEDMKLWLGEMHETLVNFLISKLCYNEDAYYYTILRMSEKVLYAGQEIKDYKAYFHRAYYTNYIQQSEQSKRFCSLGNYDQIDFYSNYNAQEHELRQIRLETDIFDYVYQNYDLREYELFKMYINLKPAINYQSLSDITSLKTHVIQRIISRILKDLRANQTFVNRYREAG